MLASYAQEPIDDHQRAAAALIDEPLLAAPDLDAGAQPEAVGQDRRRPLHAARHLRRRGLDLALARLHQGRVMRCCQHLNSLRIAQDAGGAQDVAAERLNAPISQ
jgi:hypothetical protein